MYHGVENDPVKLQYRPYDLSEAAINREIDFFIEQGYSLCSYVDVDAGNLLPSASLMLTFDDGHQNIAATVSALSSRYRIRPVIAICPGVVDAQTPFWFEEIYARLQLSARKHVHPAAGTDVDLRSAYRLIMESYLSDNTLESKVLLSTIRRATDDVDSKQVFSHAAVHKNLNWDELSALVQQDACTIAIHTMFHDSVTHMKASEFEADIHECKRLIRKHLDLECTHFVYPFGSFAGDWESEVLAKCGIRFSYVVGEKINTNPKTNCQVKRITGRDIAREPGYYRYLWHQRHARLSQVVRAQR